MVHANSALRLRAILDFTDGAMDMKIAGDEWLFEGPGTYIPRKEVEVVETVRAVIVKPNQAIKLRARKETQVYRFFFVTFLFHFSFLYESPAIRNLFHDIVPLFLNRPESRYPLILKRPF